MIDKIVLNAEYYDGDNLIKSKERAFTFKITNQSEEPINDTQLELFVHKWLDLLKKGFTDNIKIVNEAIAKRKE